MRYNYHVNDELTSECVRNRDVLFNPELGESEYPRLISALKDATDFDIYFYIKNNIIQLKANGKMIIEIEVISGHDSCGKNKYMYSSRLHVASVECEVISELIRIEGNKGEEQLVLLNDDGYGTYRIVGKIDLRA